MDEVCVLGYCECCGNQITDEDEHYMTSDGKLLCSIECVCEHYEVVKAEV